VTVPLTLGGTKIKWVSTNSFSYTWPIISPPTNLDPTLTVFDGVYSHNFDSFNAGTSTPIGTNTDLLLSAILFKGL